MFVTLSFPGRGERVISVANMNSYMEVAQPHTFKPESRTNLQFSCFDGYGMYNIQFVPQSLTMTRFNLQETPTVAFVSAVTLSYAQFEISAAIALNNMAVTMMERQCFLQAFATFKSSIYAMNGGKRKPQDQEKESSDYINARRNRIIGKLKEACRCTARPESITCFVPLNVVAHDDTVVQGLDSDEYDDDEVDCAPSSSLSLIKIDSHHVDDVDLYPDLTMIIVIYNFAVAYLCRAEAASEEEKSQARAAQLQDEATRLLKFCRGFLSRQYAECDGEDPLRLSRLIFLLSILLKTLIQTLQWYGNVDDVKACLSSLCLLRAAAANVKNALGNSKSDLAPAA